LPDQPEPPARSRPLREAADRIVRELEADRNTPCRRQFSEGVPCFPVASEETRPKWTVSVRESLGDLGPEGKPSRSRPQTNDELQARRPHQAGPNLLERSFDPGCVGKSVLKRLKGRNDTYYLYRLRDVHGDRIALYGHRLEGTTFQGALALLGQFEGECNALAAYARETRKTEPPEPMPPR
jgi:hypothetical protein